jgi:hypothetical protein
MVKLRRGREMEEGIKIRKLSVPHQGFKRSSKGIVGGGERDRNCAPPD